MHKQSVVFITVVTYMFSLLGALFALTRTVYAMANDGLLFKFLATVSGKTKTPLMATFLSGLFSGVY